MSARYWLASAALLIGVVTTAPRSTYANGATAPPTRAEPATKFERFLLDDCSPCVRETYLVKTLTISETKLPALAPQAAVVRTRAGEVRFEVLRAYPLGKASQQFLAIQANLAVATGAGELYRFATGLLDEEDVALLAAAVSTMSKTVARVQPSSSAERTDIEFHRGSLRVGVIRARDVVIAYVQAGAVHTLAPPAIGDSRTALFLTVEDLKALGDVVREMSARIQKLRGLR